jgi:hypothetical protein
VKKRLPPALPPEQLDQFVQEECDRIARLQVIALSQDRSIEERRDAIAEIRGISMRIGSMLLKSPEIKAAGTAAGRATKAEEHAARLNEAISRDEKLVPGKRGRAKRVAKDLGLHPQTVRRHLRKKKKIAL